MQGQANHFNSTLLLLLFLFWKPAAKNICLVGYAPEKIQYGINRYVNETRRLYGVMESQLAKSSSGFLVGDRLTIADVAAWGWVAGHGKIQLSLEFLIFANDCFPSAYAGVSLDEFPHVDKWLHTLLQRPGFEKGRNVPDKHTAFEVAKLTSEEMDKRAEASRAWIQKGMQDDAKK